MRWRLSERGARFEVTPDAVVVTDAAGGIARLDRTEAAAMLTAGRAAGIRARVALREDSAVAPTHRPEQAAWWAEPAHEAPAQMPVEAPESAPDAPREPERVSERATFFSPAEAPVRKRSRLERALGGS